MTRDVEVKQRQHFYHHGDTICHPRSGYVTTKLHGTSTCNNNAIFSDRAIFTFPTVAVFTNVNLNAAKHCRWLPKYRDGSAVEFLIFRVYKFVSA